MNFNDKMTKNELSNYYENRVISNLRKIEEMTYRLNNEIREYNKSLDYSNEHDTNIALKYSLDYLTEIKTNK